MGHANSGDTIVLRGGRYREGRDVRVRRSGITIKSAQNEWAVIDLTTYNSGHSDDSGVEFYCEDELLGSGSIVQNCKLQSLEVMGGFYAVGFETKLQWGQPDKRGASNIIIEDCVLHHSKNDVVKVKPNCDNITIRYNEIHHSGRAYNGGRLNGEDNSEGIDNVNGDNMHVHHNYIHDICSTGVYAKGGATGAIIENNRIERAYGAGIMVGFDTSPEFFDLTVNPLYYENINGIARNNLIINTGWEGIGIYSAQNPTVNNNTLVNVDNGPGNWHSAIYFGIPTQDENTHYGRPATTGANIHHNIVSQPNTNTRPMIEIRYIASLQLTDVDNSGNVIATRTETNLLALSGTLTMNNNCYYIAGGIPATFHDIRPTEWSGGFAGWTTRISGDTSSIEANPVLDGNYMATYSGCTSTSPVMGITVPLN